MAKILTITFAPAIDRSATVPELIPEKKLKCSANKLNPGGGGINVARVLTELGIATTAVFPSGGCTGNLLNELVAKEKVRSKIIATANPTRENLIIFEQSTGQQYRFGMPSGKLTAREWKSCLSIVEDIPQLDFLVVSGSLPTGVPVSVFTHLAEIARSKNAKLIADTSGKALKHTLSCGVYMIKPSMSELAYLAGRKKIAASEAAAIAKTIIADTRCEMIVASLGSHGAILVTKNQTFSVKPPDVEVKSTVGAGDSLVAGIVYALASGYNIEDTLRFGVACGTAAVLNHGAELCHSEDAVILYDKMK